MLDCFNCDSAVDNIVYSTEVARRDDVDGGGVTDLEIPLLMRNKVPEGFETDGRLDVTLRPKEVLSSVTAVVELHHSCTM